MTLTPEARHVAQQRPRPPRPTLRRRFAALRPVSAAAGDAMSAHARLVVAGAVLAVLATLLIAVALQAQPLAGILVAVVGSLGFGVCATLLMRPLPGSTFALLSATTGGSIAVGVGMLSAETRWWHPTAAFGALVVAAVVALGFSVRRDVRLLRTAPRVGDRPDRRTAFVAATAVGGFALALVGAARHHQLPTPGGLLSVVGPAWFVGVVLLVVSTSAALAWRRGPGLPVLGLAAVVVAAQAAVYGAPTVMSAARHLGVVDYIRVHHELRPDFDIYQAWAGLFAGTAWLADAGHLVDPQVLATWWPAVLNPLLAVGVRVVAGELGLRRSRAWAAGAVFVLANTLNITYFSPQSLGLLFALGVLVLVLQVPTAGLARRVPLIVLVASAGAVTHQLSPYFLTAAVGVLVVFRLVRPWWLVGVVLAPALAWSVHNRGTLGPYLSLSALGRISHNVTPPTHANAELPQALVTRITFDVPALALLVVGLVALAVLLQQRNRVATAVAVAAVSPASLLAVTDYGQEGIFRIALFALPWLAVLAAGLVLPSRRLGLVVATAALVVLFTANALGQTLMDWARVVRPDSASAMRWVETTAPTGSVVLAMGSGNATPSKITARYGDVVYATTDSRPEFVADLADPASVAAADNEITSYALQIPGPVHYAVVSDSTGAYDDRYGVQTWADHEAVAQVLARSSTWRVVFSGPSTTVYELDTTAGLNAS